MRDWYLNNVEKEALGYAILLKVDSECNQGFRVG
jgi:hypothetical protein